MIADEMRVTKAAVYRQFKSKDDIVIALTERELGGLEPALRRPKRKSLRLGVKNCCWTR
jgi:AcrR family transcriptional regulator